MASPRPPQLPRGPQRTPITPILIVVLALTLLASPACERSPGTSPSTPAANQSNAYLIPRVVALAPAIASNLRAAGLADFIVARHAFDAWSPGTLPIVGDQEGIDFEKLITVRPTHVFLQWGARPLPERLEALAREHAWTLVNYPLLTLEDTMDAADDMASRVREAARAAAPATPATPASAATPAAVQAPTLRAQLDQLFKDEALTDSQRSVVGKVLILHTTSPPAAMGPGSYHDQIARRLNADLAITTGSPYMTLDAEDIAALNPALIILVQPREPAQPAASQSEVINRLGVLANLKVEAVQRARFALIDDPEALLPGAPLVEFARALAKHLHARAVQSVPGS